MKSSFSTLNGTKWPILHVEATKVAVTLTRLHAVWRTVDGSVIFSYQETMHSAGIRDLRKFLNRIITEYENFKANEVKSIGVKRFPKKKQIAAEIDEALDDADREAIR
jgi:hypothetical protein